MWKEGGKAMAERERKRRKNRERERKLQRELLMGRQGEMEEKKTGRQKGRGNGGQIPPTFSS